MNRVTAVFEHRSEAERAVNKLREIGVSEDHISILARSERDTASVASTTGTQRVDQDPGSDVARGAATGAAVGAGVGVLFGLAAAVIPGIGPFITAGALANALGVTGGAAVAGATVGGTAGALSGALAKWGLDKADAEYFGREVERGGTFVAVDIVDGAISRREVEDIYREFNGRFAGASAGR
jgi:uncharacterized membrane protein